METKRTISPIDKGLPIAPGNIVTNQMSKLAVAVLGLAALGLPAGAVIAQDDADAEAKVANATSAGPLGITADATILDNAFDADGKFVVLREGTNGWFCFPDDPATPANDPVCYDEAWLDWVYAFWAGEAPNVTKPGFSYMYQGGDTASNTDPALTEPAPGEDWVHSGPHVMVILPASVDVAGLSTAHDSPDPNVMWAGTPYEHIMWPVGGTSELPDMPVMPVMPDEAS
jgi:hypothetical protein